MTNLRLLPKSDEDYPGVGVRREVVEMGDVSWEIETEIDATENDFVRRIQVNVYRDNRENPAAELIGFLGRY